MTIATETPTALYRLLDATGRLLYVGITQDPKRRFTEHAIDRSWWPDVADKTTEWYPDRDTAAAVELAVIGTESPVHNVRGTQAPPRSAPTLAPGGMTPGNLITLALSDLPPLSLRLAILELAGMGTREALDRLGVNRQNRYRVIAGRGPGQH